MIDVSPQNPDNPITKSEDKQEINRPFSVESKNPNKQVEASDDVTEEKPMDEVKLQDEPKPQEKLTNNV